MLRAGAKVGTFVEVKNSDIGAGAKVPHLSYIGDADVGEGANLGASTITANYDGHAKHRTTIGRHVRSSVHVSFVAPVTVGDRAYTAAGSVINEDVPAGALGIARPRQINKEGYAARREAQAPEGDRQAARRSTRQVPEAQAREPISATGAPARGRVLRSRLVSAGRRCARCSGEGHVARAVYTAR